MPFQYSTSFGRRLLARSTLAVTLVGSLALYHQTILTDRVDPLLKHLGTATINEPIASRNLLCRKKIIISRTDGKDKIDKEEQGEKIERCGQNYFINNKI